MNNDNLKLIYSQIIQGYSNFLFKNSVGYIKHLNALDSSIIDIKRQEYLDKAKNSGAPTYIEKLNELIDKNLWSKDKDNKIQEIKDYLANLKHTKSKYTIKRDIDPVNKEIERYNIQLFDLVLEKEKLIGKTAEHYADKKVNEYYIYHSIYSDNSLNNRLYSEEQFNELENLELDKLVKIYNDKMSIFHEAHLKKIALMPYFMNLLILAGDNIYNLFGKPIIYLTFYQVEIIQHGRTFKNILQNSKTQPDAVIMSDPDKLVEWFNKITNLEKTMGDETQSEDPNKRILSNNKSIVGMSKEELKASNIDTSAQDRVKEALKKKGSELSMMELMELEGHKVIR